LLSPAARDYVASLYSVIRYTAIRYNVEQYSAYSGRLVGVVPGRFKRRSTACCTRHRSGLNSAAATNVAAATDAEP
jgi:hypothetical protein